MVFTYSSLESRNHCHSPSSKLHGVTSWHPCLGHGSLGWWEGPIAVCSALLYSGVLVPGGFGVRGTEGKIQAIAWARKQKKPFLGKE